MEDASTDSQLLTDVRSIFAAHGNPAALPTSEIFAGLRAMEERPWNEWGKHQKPMTPHQLAAVLRPFSVTPRDIRTTEGTLKGYLFESLEDAFARYTHDPLSESMTPRQSSNDAEERNFQSATAEVPVADRHEQNPASIAACRGVANRNASDVGLGGKVRL